MMNEPNERELEQRRAEILDLGRRLKGNRAPMPHKVWQGVIGYGLAALILLTAALALVWASLHLLAAIIFLIHHL